MLKIIKKSAIVSAVGVAAFAVLALPYNTAFAATEEIGPVPIQATVDSYIGVGTGGETGGVNLDVTPDGTGVGTGTGTDTVSISTNDTNGYSLHLTMADEDPASAAITNNRLNLGGVDSATSYISSVTGQSQALAANTWGWRQGAGTTYNEAQLYGTPFGASTLVKNTGPGTTTNDTTTIQYGIQTSSTLPKGTYRNHVLYTAITNV